LERYSPGRTEPIRRQLDPPCTAPTLSTKARDSGLGGSAGVAETMLLACLRVLADRTAGIFISPGGRA
jgi:hypothetical protein